MDLSKIVVLILIAVAAGFLVWFELNSRRNTRALKLKEEQSHQSPDLKT